MSRHTHLRAAQRAPGVEARNGNRLSVRHLDAHLLYLRKVARLLVVRIVEVMHSHVTILTATDEALAVRRKVYDAKRLE